MTVNLYCDLGNSNCCRDLLVHQTGSHETHNLLLALAKRIVSAACIVDLVFVFPPLAIPVERSPHRIQQILPPKRLGKELKGSSFNGFDRHSDVAITRNKYDWKIDVPSGEFVLKVESTQSGQADIQYQATRLIR